MKESNNPNLKQEGNANPDVSGNMYSYRDENNNNNQNIQEGGAIRRSLGEGNPTTDMLQNDFISRYGQNFNYEAGKGNPYYQQNNNMLNNNSSYWPSFIIIGCFEVLAIILLAVLFEKVFKYDLNILDYGLFRDMNIMIFIGFGMLHSILRRNSWISISINILLVAFSVQFALFFNYLWKICFLEKFECETFDFTYLMKAIFVSSSVLISLGCVLGKLSLIQYIVMAIFETVFCSLNYQLCEQKLKSLDYGGALYIHTFGAIFGLAISIVLFFSSKMKRSFQTYDYLNKSSYFSNLLAFLGMFFLFCYFPSFNSVLSTDEKIRHNGKKNTYFSLFGSVMGSFITSALFNGGRFVFEQILFGSISGAVIISGCCTLCFHYWASLLIGTLGGVICVIFLTKIKPIFLRKGFQDTCNVFIVHGLSGLLGGFITPIFISDLKNIEETYFLDKKTLINGRKYNSQAGIQIAAIFITIGISFIGGIATGFLMKFTLCGKINEFFTDSAFFKEEKTNFFEYIEPNTMFNVDINNPSLFPKKFEFSINGNQNIKAPDIRGRQPSY